MKEEIIISKALECIRLEQSSTGSFISLSSTDPDDFSKAASHETTFFASTILACIQAPHLADLLSSENEGWLKEIKEKAVKFLLSQRSERWSFNYWVTTGEKKISPYPDDLDDTFTALGALIQYDAALIDEKAWISIAKLLTNLEIYEGGPYRTWIVSNAAPAKWHDIDLAVNSTVAYFLHLADFRLPYVEEFIAEAIEKDRLSSLYYPNITAVYYLISRFYKNNEHINVALKQRVAELISAHIKNGNEKNILEWALSISSVANLGFSEMLTPDDVSSFLFNIEKEGFKPYAFCIDPARDGKRSYAGSSATTAACCIEAIFSFYHKEEQQNKKQISRHAHIQQKAANECTNIGPELRLIALQQIERTSDKSITSLAHEFGKALEAKNEHIPMDIIDQLSLANLYGWMAYTIYDNLIDEEGNPALLSCANFFFRKLIGICNNLNERIPGVMMLCNEMMDTIDSANTWESENCKSPIHLPKFEEYSNLADRSIGSAMGPLIQLLSIGKTKESTEYKNFLQFFRHYLIGRQLNDDARDWDKDLLHQHTNSIGSLVLETFQKRYPHKINDPITAIISNLKKIFMETPIDEATALIFLHIAKAREIKGMLPTIAGTDFMEAELSSLESAAQKSLHKRDQTLLFFLDFYGKTLPMA
jgi:hypothetical protein